MKYTSREMSLSEMKDIYDQYMMNDFPKDELKPFSSMERMYQEKSYRGYVMEQEGVLLAYWLLLYDEKKRTYLLDYFAVIEEKRGNGYGSHALSNLLCSIGEDEIIMIEAENPEREKKESLREIQTRRLDFYRKNGAVDTGVSSVVFQVPYVILTLSQQKVIMEREKVKRQYWDFYEKSILNKEKCQKHVIIE